MAWHAGESAPRDEPSLIMSTSQQMKVLGIMWEQNSTAALLVDGHVVASASEERFSRIKNDERYPKRAIEYVLAEGGILPADLDAVAFIGRMWGPMYALTRHYSSFTIEDNLREQREYWKPILYEGKRPDYLKVFRDKLDLDQYPGRRIWTKVIADVRRMRTTGRAGDKRAMDYFQGFRRDVVALHLGVDPARVRFVDHSTGHAAYAYFGSNLRKDALIATADAWGDDANATLTEVRRGVMRRIYATDELAVARLYRYTTLLLGMKPNEHEYKVMGLAPYAKSKYYQRPLSVYRGVQDVDGLRLRFKHKPTDFYYYFLKKFEGVRFDAIAGALQEYTEEVMMSWIGNAARKTRLRNVGFAGGVAMNVKANMLLHGMPAIGRLYVNPTPDDASQAMGACYAYVYSALRRRGIDPRKVLQPLSNAYLGPAIDDVEVERLLADRNVARRYRITRDAPAETIARLLARGGVIGRAVGRSEFGARSLGNRSILADPRNAEVVVTINEKVKNRDFWMPFAPTVLEARAHDYLIGYKGDASAAYMTIGFPTTALGQLHLRAGIHPSDKTCRPQVLPRGQNKEYEALIKAFERQTGVGGVLNTSFNLHGEPIVQTAADAWRVFELTKLDALVLNGTLIEKRRASRR